MPQSTLPAMADAVMAAARNEKRALEEMAAKAKQAGLPGPSDEALDRLAILSDAWIYLSQQALKEKGRGDTA